MSNQDTRLQRLKTLADENVLEIYDDEAAECYEGTRPVPRYVLLTAEGGHQGNPNLTVHDSLRSVQEQATGEANEEYVWSPQTIRDLDADQDVAWSNVVLVAGAGPPGLPTEEWTRILSTHDSAIGMVRAVNDYLHGKTEQVPA